MHTASSVDITKENLLMGDLRGKIISVGGFVGAASLLVSFVLGATNGDDLARFQHSYIHAFTYFLAISLGALFFVAVQHLTAAHWSVVVRRIAEVMAATLPFMFLLLLPILIALLLGNHSLYEWADAELVSHDKLLQDKQPYLNVPFFLVRVAGYFAFWSLLSWHFLSKGREQDENADPKITEWLQSVSAPGLVVFALTTTFCSFDLLMSLEPHWFSTMFGVYYFASCALSFFAGLIGITYFLQRNGRLEHVVSVEHYHDMGKFLFGFTAFWGYIAFSQFMLIWYANIPEETQFFLPRQQGVWFWFSIVLIVFHFAIPFFGLMNRNVKRIPWVLASWAVYILVVHWFGLYWLIIPAIGHHGGDGSSHMDASAFHVLDLTCMLGIGGLYTAAMAFVANDEPLLAKGDPRLADSLAHVNSY